MKVRSGLVWLWMVGFASLASGFEVSASHPDYHLCEHYIADAEKRYRLPPRLLHAMSLVESGQWDAPAGQLRPWPWTINVEGTPYRFPTKTSAIQAVRLLRGKGFRSIDVGCLQVNLHHHPHAFLNLEHAFEPRHNIAYAAKTLLAHWKDRRHWSEAVAAYHSKTASLGSAYAMRVWKHWHPKEPGMDRMRLSSAPRLPKNKPFDMRRSSPMMVGSLDLHPGVPIAVQSNHYVNARGERELAKRMTAKLLHEPAPSQ